MAGRRSEAQWSKLSPAYRARLERGGLTRSDYLAGVPLSAARGHSQTPERPERVKWAPERYAKYTAKKLGNIIIIPVTWTDNGARHFEVRKVEVGSRLDRVLASHYANAVSNYLHGGKVNQFGVARDERLSDYVGKSVTGYDLDTGVRRQWNFIANSDQIDALASSGGLSPDYFYLHPQN